MDRIIKLPLLAALLAAGIFGQIPKQAPIVIGGGGSSSGGNCPGGSDTQVQFKDGATDCGGDAGFTYNKTTDVASLVGGLSTGAAPVSFTAGTSGAIGYTEGTAPTPASGTDILYGDSTAHRLKMASNNGTAQNVAGIVAAGTKALATGAITSATCTSAQTVAATGTATTDVINATFNGDPTAVTGYVPLTAGMLTIIAYPTADTVNFKVCNNTSGSITPGAITLNWQVIR